MKRIIVVGGWHNVDKRYASLPWDVEKKIKITAKELQSRIKGKTIILCAPVFFDQEIAKAIALECLNSVVIEEDALRWNYEAHDDDKRRELIESYRGDTDNLIVVADCKTATHIAWQFFKDFAIDNYSHIFFLGTAQVCDINLEESVYAFSEYNQKEDGFVLPVPIEG